MLQAIREFVRICSQILPVSEPIYEFGSLRVEDQEDIANMRPFFPGKKYIGSDIRAGSGVDVILDLHNIDLPSNSAATILLLETLEHTEFPRKAIEECFRVLQPNGILIISAPFDIPIHNCPNDYWRFTMDGFRSLLKPFETSMVYSIGIMQFKPHSIIGIGMKGALSDKTKKELERKIKELQRSQAFVETVRVIIPPIIYHLVKIIYHWFLSWRSK
jgi:SAM-dependent methyltransferase